MEQKLITWLEENFSATENAQRNVVLGIGDDGAILEGADSNQVLVADAIVENVHFDLSEHELADVGAKALSVNLSDIAAMGAVAESALVSLVIPRAFELSQAKDLFSGLATVAKRFSVALVGGDTTCHDGPLMISVSATGRIENHFVCPDGWRMDGAEIGDLVVVTGALGGSITGHHLNFTPRLEVAAAIQERVPVNAATDISDSLSLDLSHVLRKSGVAARVNANQIPISAAAIELASDTGESPLHHALYDGEDFELLLCLSQQSYDQLVADSSFSMPLTKIGFVTEGESGQILNVTTGERIAVSGYEHN